MTILLTVTEKKYSLQKITTDYQIMAQKAKINVFYTMQDNKNCYYLTSSHQHKHSNNPVYTVDAGSKMLVVFLHTNKIERTKLCKS